MGELHGKEAVHGLRGWLVGQTAALGMLQTEEGGLREV